MEKKLHLDPLAEREATDIGAQFMHSADVVGDMSRAYGRDLSSVRIHTDADAARSAGERGVDAFSTGRDVFFAQGAYDRNDPASRGLLAHELSHSMQQGVGGGASVMAQSAPMGAEQGGLLDWFRGLFGRRRAPEPEPQIEISGPLELEKNTSEDSLKYMKAMDPYLRKERIARAAAPAPTIGRGGGAAAAQAFSAALRGDGGQMNYLQRSNEGLAGGRNNALVNLGIRTSEDAPSKAEKVMRGDIYKGLSDDYSTLLLNLENNGLDAEDMMRNGTVASAFAKTADNRMEKLAYATGAGFDELNNKALDMFSAYVLSDESLDYIRDFSAGVAPAAVFGGQKSGLGGATGFALQTLVNTVGGNVNQAATDQRLSGAGQRVAANMGRTIGSLPKMASLPEENLPESLRPLRARYIQLQEELDRRLAERSAT